MNGRELAGFIKERQARQVAGGDKKPKLLIIRDSENPVIRKYVDLKIRYGEDIGVEVEDFCAGPTDTLAGTNEIMQKITESNSDDTISGIILQLPIADKHKTEELTGLIRPEKDVDGLGREAKYDSATATAILWLLAGYDITLKGKKIALVGRGKLVGAPLYKMFKNSGYDVELFHRGSDLTKLKQFDIIITATGVPGLILSAYVKPGAVVVDAGTASEKGILRGDLAPEVRERDDLFAITPEIGGVGPLTVACLFEHVIEAASI